MTGEQNTQKQAEVCVINIAFPVVSDEDALSIKQKLTEALKDKPGVSVDFRIRSMNRPTLPGL